MNFIKLLHLCNKQIKKEQSFLTPPFHSLNKNYYNAATADCNVAIVSATCNFIYSVFNSL